MVKIATDGHDPGDGLTPMQRKVLEASKKAGMTPVRQQIYREFLYNSPTTCSSIARQLGKSAQAVARTAGWLYSCGLLVRTPSTYIGRYMPKGHSDENCAKQRTHDDTRRSVAADQN